MGVAQMTYTGTKSHDEIKAIDEQRILNWLQTAYKQRQIVNLLFGKIGEFMGSLNSRYDGNAD